MKLQLSTTLDLNNVKELLNIIEYDKEWLVIEKDKKKNIVVEEFLSV